MKLPLLDILHGNSHQTWSPQSARIPAGYRLRVQSTTFCIFKTLPSRGKSLTLQSRENEIVFLNEMHQKWGAIVFIIASCSCTYFWRILGCLWHCSAQWKWPSGQKQLCHSPLHEPAEKQPSDRNVPVSSQDFYYWWWRLWTLTEAPLLSGDHRNQVTFCNYESVCSVPAGYSAGCKHPEHVCMICDSLQEDHHVEIRVGRQKW